jgi:ketosteroid isomerase-like protein
VRRRLDHEWVVDRSRTVDGELDHIGDRRRREVRNHHERKHDRPAPEPHPEHSERQPDEAVAAEVRERDEERVDGLGAVTYDPALEPLIEADQIGRICFA